MKIKITHMREYESAKDAVAAASLRLYWAVLFHRKAQIDGDKARIKRTDIEEANAYAEWEEAVGTMLNARSKAI